MKSKSRDDLVLIYTTFPDLQCAEKLSQLLVEKKLAACANMFSPMIAIYQWKDEMQRDEEVAVLFKTTRTRREELSNKLAQLHPYDTPAIICFDAAHVEGSYLSWVQSQTLS